jgi:error-prone DNA polymerase
MTPDYAELHCVSNFSFQRGASHPGELMLRAGALGYRALALTDECSVAGVVRAHEAAREIDCRLIVGTEIRLEEGDTLVLLAASRSGYGNLCRLITRGRRGARKGAYRLARSDLEHGLADCLALWVPGRGPDAALDGRPGTAVRWLADRFPGRCWIAVELLAGGRDRERLRALQALGRSVGVPLVACGDVHMHEPARRPLQDVLTAIRLKTPVAEAGHALFPNGERHLRSRERLARIYPPELLAASVAVAERCRFDLSSLRYEYPAELVPEGWNAAGWLRHLTREGMARRWPGGVPESVRRLVEHELNLIGEMAYEAYFLTVHDIVAFARSRGILCQGRGSAANSAVCFCLGITEVDPGRMSVLFERFISRERNEPPDIDVDFEHERREEVIQYIYRRYGRDRAALAATVISYRPRSAIRDVGKALGLHELQIDRLATSMNWWDGRQVEPERVREAGFDPDNPVICRLLRLVEQLMGFPRHLSQHVGGFVISAGPLHALVPVENAAMPERTVIQWDKNDLETLGLIKVDVLGLGMLSAIRRALDLVRAFRGRSLSLASVPAEDPAVYDMIGRADTMGVFQIESRAQMAMLPRMRPRCYYDLVIEVAIIRPGPIQGDMVHPYLRRRDGLEAVTYPSEEVRGVLERTLGVPIFQEQVMQLAVVAAGFSPGEADRLRRAMAAWRRRGGLGPFEKRLIEGMRRRGYSESFAQQIFHQIQGFGEYGFPESHSASFALLVYVSAWLKRHEPAIFLCALLNSQPMGFYAPSQLVQDACRHGVEVRGVDVTVSRTEAMLEQRADGEPAVRLGLGMAKGLSETGAERIVAAREAGRFSNVEDLARRAGLDARDLEALADANALETLSGHRYLARWRVAGIQAPVAVLESQTPPEADPLLRRPGEGEDVVADYRSLGLTLRTHPLALLRPRLDRLGALPAAALWERNDGDRVCYAGMVINRQRPGSAKGVTFVTLEDETGHANIIVWKRLGERQRKPLLGARLLEVRGRIHRQGDVLHVVAERLTDRSRLLGALMVRSRNFR